jgi:Ca2+-binding RTX toxin-like protein
MSAATASASSESVCYIVATFADGTTEQGSGAIVGAHSVLTASHLLWNATTGQAAVSVAVCAGYNSGGQAISGPYIEHFNQINDAGGLLSKSSSQSDFAIIDFAQDLSGYGAFGLAAGFSGGTVNVTGYPASASGAQVSQTGVIQADAHYATLDYVSVASTPGNSGAPVWIDAGAASDPQPTVVGVVSTTGWASQLTASDLATINAWEKADSYLWGASGSTQQSSQVIASTADGGASSATAAVDAGPAESSGVTVSGSDPVTYVGTSGADSIVGADGQHNVVHGGDGADSIVGGSGFNQVNGNAGDDTVVGHSHSGDWLVGGQGQDLIDASASTGNNILNGNLGNDTLIGGAGADTLRGGQGDDVIHAGLGDDWISGDLGTNTIYGGQGTDTFRAGAGHDLVSGWHDGDHVSVAAGVTYHVTQTNGDLHIVFSNGGEMDLLNVQQSSLQSGWIIGA